MGPSGAIHQEMTPSQTVGECRKMRSVRKRCELRKHEKHVNIPHRHRMWHTTEASIMQSILPSTFFWGACERFLSGDGEASSVDRFGLLLLRGDDDGSFRGDPSGDCSLSKSRRLAGVSGFGCEQALEADARYLRGSSVFGRSSLSSFRFLSI